MIPESMVTFAGNCLDRADRLRADEAAMARLLADPASRALAFWRGRPLFDTTGAAPRLAWLPAPDPLIALGPEPVVFLGLDPAGIAHFAADLSHLAVPDDPSAGGADAAPPDLSEGQVFLDLRAVMGQMDHGDAGVAAAAKGIFEWRLTHGFCANCGGCNTISHAGWRARCPDCGREHFPRVDPVVIMLVLDGDRVLLGRQPSWPDRMYSLLAGFIEPGETIEEAVRRETMEEAGIEIGEVSYLTSQPWPFPASLMIGCKARARSRAITIDPHEMEDAIWVPRAEIVEALAGRNDRIAPARKGAIAQIILRAWADGAIAGFDD